MDVRQRLQNKNCKWSDSERLKGRPTELLSDLKGLLGGGARGKVQGIGKSAMGTTVILGYGQYG